MGVDSNLGYTPDKFDEAFLTMRGRPFLLFHLVLSKHNIVITGRIIGTKNLKYILFSFGLDKWVFHVYFLGSYQKPTFE